MTGLGAAWRDGRSRCTCCQATGPGAASARSWTGASSRLDGL